MIELAIPAISLKDFTRALNCLVKFGDDIDVSAHATQLKLSSINSSRSAFGCFIFESSFFSRYDVALTEEGGPASFCVTGKALLAPLRSRSAATIESCTLSLTDDDPDRVQEPGAEGGECRLVIRLHCQHGIIKTHRLTYSNATMLYANASRSKCTSAWSVSSKVLKEWTDHFHLKAGSQGGTEEISFYCEGSQCRIKSFGGAGGQDDPLTSRPLTTELLLDVEDFDSYDVPDNPIVTLALKEFKAIVTLADSVNAPLSAAFARGNAPIILDLAADTGLFKAHFVVATTDYDSGDLGTGEAVKREKSESVARAALKATDRRSVSGAGNAVAGPSKQRVVQAAKKGQPLFNPESSQEQGGQDEDEDEDEDEDGDEFGGMDFGADDFAAIDRLSQVPPTGPGRGSQARVVLVQDSGYGDFENQEREGHVQGGDDDGMEGPGSRLPTPSIKGQLGPTQDGKGAKKAKWNLLDAE